MQRMKRRSIWNLPGRSANVPLSVHLGLYQDETAAMCKWHIPQTHFLESWSDVRASDGTATIVQPLIAPLYGGRTPHELLRLFTDPAEATNYEIVRETWRRHWSDARPTSDFETFWETTIHDGVVSGTVSAARQVSLRSDWTQKLTSIDTAPASGCRPR